MSQGFLKDALVQYGQKCRFLEGEEYDAQSEEKIFGSDPRDRIYLKELYRISLEEISAKYHTREQTRLRSLPHVKSAFTVSTVMSKLGALMDTARTSLRDADYPMYKDRLEFLLFLLSVLLADYNKWHHEVTYGEIAERFWAAIGHDHMRDISYSSIGRILAMEK